MTTNSISEIPYWQRFRLEFVSNLRLIQRNRSEILLPLVFFIIITTLFPLAVDPEDATLRLMAPGVLWVGILLAMLLGLDGLFRDDYDSGALEQLCLLPEPLSLICLARVLAHWLCIIIPLVILAPFLAYILKLPPSVLPQVLFAMVIGSLTMLFLGAIGSALTVTSRRGNLLLPLLVLPFCIPILVFATTWIKALLDGATSTPHPLYLLAFMILALTLAPLAIAACLRTSMN